MISDDESSLDIVIQIQAARAALQSISKIILEKHLRHCVTDVLDKGNEAARDEKFEEIMTVIKRLES